MLFNRFFKLSLLLYESVRMLVILLAYPPASERSLALSWYASAPLLAFPVMLAALLYADAENNRVYTKLYMLTKIMSGIGMVYYMTANFRKDLLFLLIFLVIDGILVWKKVYHAAGN
jgi:hypothetical protein